MSTEDTTRATLADVPDLAILDGWDAYCPGASAVHPMYESAFRAGYRAALAQPQPQQAAPARTWDEFGRTNAGDETGGAVQRFGFALGGSKPDILPATNGAFVYYDDYLALHRRLAAAPAGQAAASDTLTSKLDQLPALPTPWICVRDNDDELVSVWRAFQMRDYARACMCSLLAEISALREQVARFTPLRAKGVVDADDNLDCWDTEPFEICHDHVAALNEKDPAAMWRVVDLYFSDGRQAPAAEAVQPVNAQMLAALKKCSAIGCNDPRVCGYHQRCMGKCSKPLIDASTAANLRRTDAAAEAAPAQAVRLTESQIEDCIDAANRAFNGRNRGPGGQQMTTYDDWKHWLAREVERAANGLRGE